MVKRKAAEILIDYMKSEEDIILIHNGYEKYILLYLEEDW
jgi:hypothetical protein